MHGDDIRGRAEVRHPSVTSPMRQMKISISLNVTNKYFIVFFNTFSFVGLDVEKCDKSGDT